MELEVRKLPVPSLEGGRVWQSRSLPPHPPTPASCVEATVFILSSSSSAAEPPPAVPTDPEPEIFPQEPPLDPLPGELTASREGLSGEGGRNTVKSKGSFLIDMG